MMDIRAYWNAVLAQNAMAIRDFFREDGCVNWHNTNEQFTVEEFIQANCQYPGHWAGEVEKETISDDTIVTAVHVYSTDPPMSFHVASFFHLSGGKIASIDEYWGDDGPAPQWRQEMGLGRQIRKYRSSVGAVP